MMIEISKRELKIIQNLSKRLDNGAILLIGKPWGGTELSDAEQLIIADILRDYAEMGELENE